MLNDRPSAEISALLEVLLASPLDHLDKVRKCSFNHTLVMQLLCNQDNDSFLFQICSGELHAVNGKENVSRTNYSADPLIWLDRITCIYRMLKPWQDQVAYRQERHEVITFSVK